jgi:hypothetical protein
MTVYLIPCLVQLRGQFDDLNPGRDKASDGWIGDAAHQTGTSDHKPLPDGRVLAVDVDSSGPWPVPFATLVASLVDRHRRGLDYRAEYIIFDRVIYSRSRGYAGVAYTGADPHTGHAHVSGRHDHAGQNDMSSWGIASMAAKDDPDAWSGLWRIEAIANLRDKVAGDSEVAGESVDLSTAIKDIRTKVSSPRLNSADIILIVNGVVEALQPPDEPLAG